MKARRLFEGICVAFSLIFFSCEKIDVVDNPVKQDGTDVMSLSLKGNDGLEYKSFFINDSTIHVVVPKQYDCSGLTSIVNHNALHASIDDVELNEHVRFDFSDFKSPKELKVVSSLGKGKKYKIVVHDLPVIVIDTPDNRAIDSKTERVEGCIVRLVEAPGKIDSLGVASIRGRGQSSWEQPKKPYNIKFETKTPILGMPKSKHWILLANAFYDRTQLHNATAFEMARMTDYPWVPDGRFVELILNGEHKGLYYICEKIREGKGKIELGDNDFLLESYVVLKDGFKESSMPDNYIKTQYFNETGQPPYECVLGWESKYPEEPDSDTKTKILSKLEEVEHFIYDEKLLLSGEYRSKLDIETAINWFLIQEATLNEEASRTKNVYLYTVGGALYVGPPWDFDAWTFGLYGTKYLSCNKSALYYSQLLKDPVFVNRLKEKWTVYKQIWEDKMPSYIDNLYNEIHRAAERNEKMWPDWHTLNYPDDKSYHELIDDMKNSLYTQLSWLDEEISKF